MTLGFGCQATANVTPAPPLSFWANGGYWDLTQIAGFNGDAMPSSPIPSAVGVNSLTVVNAPLIQDSAIAGLRAMACTSGALSNFQCNALASRITSGQPWTMYVEYCATSGALPVPVMCAGSSADAIHNYFRLEQLNGTQFLTLFQNTVANGPTTTNVPTDLQFNPHQVIVRCDGTNITGMIDTGAIFSLGTIDPAGFTCDRLSWGAIVSTAIGQGGDVLFTKIAFSFNRMTDAQMIGQINAGIAAHLTVPIGQAPYFAWSGDSEVQGDTGNNAGGFRDPIGHFIQDCGMSVYPWGPSAQGWFQYRSHVAQGGAGCAQVATNFVNALNALAGAPDLVINLMGTNNMGAILFPTSPADYQAAATVIANALLAKKPNAKILLTKLLAFDPTDLPFAPNGESFNATLVSTVWPALEAAFPGVFIYPNEPNSWNTRTSIPVFNPAKYVDTTHLNTTGYNDEADDQVLTFGPLLRLLSTTVNVLGVNVSSPAAGTVLHVGVPVTVKFGATRWPYHAAVKVDGTTVASATVTRTVLGQAVFSPVLGQVGAGVVTCEVTDLLDLTTAVSPGVAVTIAP